MDWERIRAFALSIIIIGAGMAFGFLIFHLTGMAVEYGNRYNLRPIKYYRVYKTEGCYDIYKYISDSDSMCIYGHGHTLQEAEQIIAKDSLRLSRERVR